MTGKEIANGRRVFKEIYNQIQLCLEINSRIFKSIKPSLVLNDQTKQRLALFDDEYRFQYCIISLSYSIVFFGVAKESSDGLSNALEKDFSEKFVRNIYDFYRIIPSSKSKYYSDWEKLYTKEDFLKNYHYFFKDKIKFSNLSVVEFPHFMDLNRLKNGKEFFKFFGGHQSKLGHYFRHLFQTVKYIDKQYISYEDKYDYIKTLRAQLSNYEQYLFFLNSVAFMGREWEINHSQEYDQLITKYNLIKNIPFTTYKYVVDNKSYRIDFQKFYPLVHFELENKPLDRDAFIERIQKIDSVKEQQSQVM